MKNILSILLVSILLFGCSKEDKIQDTVLDSLLYGHWENYYNGSNYNMVLSSNGQFVYWRDDSSGNDNGGDWWVEGSTLVLSGDQYDIGGTYSVSGNSLEWDDRSWDK